MEWTPSDEREKKRKEREGRMKGRKYVWKFRGNFCPFILNIQFIFYSVLYVFMWEVGRHIHTYIHS